MRILILGAGGIGGYFGGRLAAAGADVTFLVREARAARLQETGLVLTSPLGDAHLTPRIATQATLAGAYDLVIVSCKAYDLDSAIAAIRPAVGPGTTILPLLNGLAHLDRLDAAFAADQVLGGAAYISVTLASDGTIRHLNKLDGLTYGARTPAQAARCESIAQAVAGAQFSPKNSPNILQDMWEKFAFITAAAAITCLMRASVKAIMAADDGERLTRRMIEECEGVAAASGYPIQDKSKRFAVGFLTDRTSDFTASMLRDLEAGLEVEADQLPGDMIRRGEAHGVATDLLRAAYAHLQAYQARRTASR